MESAVGAYRAVLFDRDGTLVEDVPYNGDPALVRPVQGAKELLDHLRARGIKVVVISNQSGVARGLITNAQVEAVNARVEEVLGPFDGFFYCAHRPDEGCRCRKPMPGLIEDAARALGVKPHECVVAGDKDSDMQAAHAAGAQAVRVPHNGPLSAKLLR